MARFRLSVAARLDLRGIADYTRDRWGAEQALRYAAQLEDAFKLLEKMPRIGKKFPGLEGKYRSLSVGKHVIFYREEGDGAFIVRVLPERMLPGRRLSESD